MKSTELRLGNLANHISFGIVKIKGVNELSLKCQYKENQYWDDVKHYRPITLNEEWLLKFGFDGCKYPNKEIQVGTIKNDFIHKKMSFCWKGFVLYKIQHVHELQNIFFALTGEELTLKSEL